MAKAQNVQNLDPVRTREEAAKRGAKGGAASGESKRAKKQLREELLALLGATDKETGMKIKTLMSAALVRKALTGDTRAFEVIRDTIGEKPRDGVDLNAQIDISADDKALLMRCEELLDASDS